MYDKLRKIFLITLFFLLQSCSGGKIGNFLESSFRNIEIEELDNKENILKNKKENNNEQRIFLIKKTNKEENKKNKLVKNKNLQIIEKNKKEENFIKEKIILEANSDGTSKKTFKTESLKNRKIYRPQSYRITVILNEVDPSSPLENFSNILRNSNLNFEIENIQRYPRDKNINRKDEQR